MRMQEIKLLLEQAAASEGQQKRLSFCFSFAGEEGKGRNVSRLNLSSRPYVQAVFPSLEDR